MSEAGLPRDAREGECKWCVEFGLTDLVPGEPYDPAEGGNLEGEL